MKEYRVVWKRKPFMFKPDNDTTEPFEMNPKPKMKVYKTLRGAQHRISLLGDAPWDAFGLDPDRIYCCDGQYCGCGGVTVRTHFLDSREGMSPIEYIHLEEREVGRWRVAT